MRTKLNIDNNLMENFDEVFFQSTMITEWDLVCEDKWMKTFAKLLLFSGKSLKAKLTELILGEI